MTHYLDIIEIIKNQLDEAEKEFYAASKVLDDNNINLYDVSNPSVTAYHVASAKCTVLSNTLIAAWEASK